MYQILRQVHYYTGFFLLVFIVMYFASGYVMTRHAWFGDPEPTVVKRSVPLETDARGEPAFGLEGRRAPGRREKDGSWRFEFTRPGYQATAIVRPGANMVEITERHHKWQRTLIGFHRLHNYRGGWLYALWAALMDLSSAAMIVFAVTGVWMWFKLSRRRWPGYLLLGAGFTYTAATIVYLLRA